MALAVPLSRFTPRVGGGSAFFVRPTSIRIMKYCPHCHTKVSVLVLLRTTRWSPYKCPGCSDRFQRETIPSAILGGAGGGIGTLLFFVALLFHSILIGMFEFVALFALTIWADWHWVPFREIEKDEPKTSA